MANIVYYEPRLDGDYKVVMSEREFVETAKATALVHGHTYQTDKEARDDAMAVLFAGFTDMPVGEYKLGGQ